MAYVVTARRWRPQRFEEMVGQGHVCRTLKNAIHLGQVAHAYLFSGSRGVGKTTVARLLAKALNCAAGPTPEPCNRCDACREIGAGRALDVVEIDGASNRGIDEIRDLRERLKYATASGRYKVYIIDEVHMLTREAFNALLKSLEEPPAHVVFIFATTDPQKVPDTILSRCQCFSFKRLTEEEIVAQLLRIATAEGLAIGEGHLRRIAVRAEGSMRDAQGLLDQVIAFADGEVGDQDLQMVLGLIAQEELLALGQGILKRDGVAVLGLMHRLLSYGYDLRDFHREVLAHLRNLLVAKAVDAPAELVPLPPGQLKQLQAQAEQFSVEDLHRLLHLWARAEVESRGSPSPRLVLEIALLKMTQLQPLRPLEGVLARLEQLERHLAAGGPGPWEAEPAQLPIPGVEGQPDRGEDPPGQQQEAQPPAPSGEASSEQLWQAIITRVSGQKPRLGAILSYGRLLRLREDELLLGFQRGGALYGASLLEEENRHVLRQAATEVLGRAVRVTVEEIEEGGERVGAGSPPPPPRGGSPILPEAGPPPEVQQVLELFNGAVLTPAAGPGGSGVAGRTDAGLLAQEGR